MATITITVELDFDERFLDIEEFEDTLGTCLGGMGYAGHLTCGEYGNEVHFPVIDPQPLALLEKATVNARNIAENDEDWSEDGEQ